jgi:serine/threonine protein kinase
MWLKGFYASDVAPGTPRNLVDTDVTRPSCGGCSTDARRDLCSLGVTLYQMLTGALPFAAADPLEWVHCDIARQLTPPGGRAAVSEPLSAFTMKLLAKNAEEHYQTASGLEADLRRCRAERIMPSPNCIATPFGRC